MAGPELLVLAQAADDELFEIALIVGAVLAALLFGGGLCWFVITRAVDARIQGHLRAIRNRLESLEHQAASRTPKPAPPPMSPRPATPPTPTPQPPPPSTSPPPPDPRPEPPAPLEPPPVRAPDPQPAPARVPEPVALSDDAARPVNVEERLGTRIIVWIGAVALVLGAAFLVKYSFDRDLLSPEIRVGLGGAFGLALLGLGEWLRRRSAWVAQAVTAAGVATLFAALLASTTLYGFIGPVLGFVLMAAITAGAVLLSLRHGPFVALLGLIGGFATPALIGAEEIALVPMLGYILLLQVGLVTVIRARAWPALGALTLAGAVLWALVLFFTAGAGADRLWVMGFLLATVLVHVLAGFQIAPSQAPPKTPVTGMAAAGVGAVLIGLFGVAEGFTGADLGMLLVLGAGLIVLARIDPRYVPLVAIGAGASAVTLLAWRATAAETPSATQYAGFTLVCGLLYALGAFVAMWRSADARPWAWISGASALAFFAVAWIGFIGLHTSGDVAWWLPAMLLAGAFALAAWLVRSNRSEIRGAEHALGAFALVAGVFVLIAGVEGLDYPWWPMAWAATGALGAWVFRVAGIATLRGLAATVSVLTLLALMSPGIADLEHGHLPVLNALLPAYAVPTVALGLVCAWLGAAGAVRSARVAHVCAIVAGALGAAWLVRHGFHTDDFPGAGAGFYEYATYGAAALVAAHALLLWDRLRPDGVRRGGGLALAGIGVAVILLWPVLLANPILVAEPVGRLPVLNGLLYLYAVPMLLLAALPAVAGGRLARELATGAGGLALLLLFVLVTLQVRHAFVGPVLAGTEIAMGEWYAYSVAWSVLGAGLLLAGIRFGSAALRYGSLAVMLVAVGKVFVFDTARLDDLYRVLSFFGLGVTLLGLGYLYQRFVFGRGVRGEESSVSPVREPDGS